MTMKIATIAFAMTLATTPAFASMPTQASPDRSSDRSLDRLAAGVARLGEQIQGLALSHLGSFEGQRTLRSTMDLGAPHAGPAVPAARQGDPADSLYRVARQALNQRDYTRAAGLFKQVTDRYPRSPSAPSAMYFRAFALYQTGGVDRMRESRDVLSALARDYPNADLSDARSLRLQVCGQLARRGDADCAADVARAADGDQNASRETSRSGQNVRCSEDENDERIVALNAVLQMDPDRAMPLLKRVMERRDACAYVLRRKAVFLISQKGGEDAADLLMQTAKTDPDRETREQAIFWLGQVRSDRAVTLLEDVLKGSSDRDVKDKAIFALSQQSSSRAAQILRDFVERESEPEDLREQAIFWLGQKRSEDNATYLKALYGRMKSNALKEKVIFSLSQQRGFGNAEWIMNIALDTKESTELRKQALFWAGQGGAPVEQFATLYDRITEPEIKEQLIFVFSQRRDDKALDKLMDIAKNDKDREMRSKAIFWIGQRKDARATKFLEELISKQ